MKSYILTAAAIAISLTCSAQLYSSGNNNIPGSHVGIGTSQPDERLVIKSSYNPNQPTCIGCPPASNNPPGLRISTQLTGAINPTTHHWDLDGEGVFSINHRVNSGAFFEIMKMDDEQVSLNTAKVNLTPGINTYTGSGITGVKSIIGLGVQFNQSSGNWENINGTFQGSAILAKSGGALEFRTGVNASGGTLNALLIKSDGKVGIGIANPTARLEVADGDLKINDGRLVISDGTNNQFEVNSNGYVVAREILVDFNEAIPDYVFSEGYNLLTLDEIRDYVQNNHHLPNIPSASDFEAKGGIEVGELTRLLLEKQEELLLYILQLEERLAHVESSNID